MKGGVGDQQAPQHDWSIPSRPGGLAIQDENEYAAAANAAPILRVDEAERFVEGLREFDIDSLGNSQWMDQHRRVVQLNMQAHQSAMAHSDEFVLEAMLTFDKVKVLVHELLAVEAWTENVFPRLLKTDRVRSGLCNMRIYFALYHEAALSNLFEVLLFHRHICREMGDTLVEIVDYCARKLVILNSSRRLSEPRGLRTLDAKELAASLEQRDAVKDLLDQADGVALRVCVTAVTMLRYICEHLGDLPLGVLTRVLDTHDVLLGVIPLIENPPWTRRLESGNWEKFIDFTWRQVPPADLMMVTKPEAQVWITMFHLMMQPECRQRYHFNSFRKDQILRARKYINDLLLDQLPILADVQRYMDELTIMDVPPPTAAPVAGGLLMEQVPHMREKLVKGVNWDALVEVQIQEIWKKFTDASDPDLRQLGMLYQEDSIEAMFDPSLDLSEARRDCSSLVNPKGV